MSLRADFRHSGEEAQLEVNLFASGSKYMMINLTLWLQDKQKPNSGNCEHSLSNVQYSSVRDSFISGEITVT